MNFDDATSAATDALRRPSEVLPVFLAESALGVIVQSTLFVAAGAAVLSLGGTGRIERFLDAFRSLGADPSDAEARAFLDALGGLFTPSVLAIVAVATTAAVILVVIVRAALGAAKAHAARAALTGGDPTAAAVAGAEADVRPFVWLTLLQTALLGGPLVLGAGGALLVRGRAGLGLLGLSILVWIPVAIVTYFGLLFAPEAIVVEGVGLRAALRSNVSYIGTHTARSVGVGALEVGGLFAVGALGNVLTSLGVGRLAGLVVLFAYLPVVALVKMGLFLESTAPGAGVDDQFRSTGAGQSAENHPSGDEPPRSYEGDRHEPGGPGTPPDDRGRGPATGDADGFSRHPDRTEREAGSSGVTPAHAEGEGSVDPASGRRPEQPPDATGPGARSLLAEGVAELRQFVAYRPGLVGVSLVAFFVGVAGGYWVAASTGIDVVGEGPVDPGFGAFPLATAVDLAANNWTVAIAQTFSGLVFGVPALVNLLFNGVIVGGLAGLGFDTTTFAALVVPHGIVEVPALAVSGALGLHLAGRALAFRRDELTAREAGAELRRAFLVLVGLGPVFLVAGVVEAFVTPAVGRAVLGVALPLIGP